MIFQCDFLKDLYARETEIKAEIDSILSRQELLNKENSRIKWLRKGDKNSTFFHALLKRRKINRGY